MPVSNFDETEPGKHLQAARDMLAFHGIDPNDIPWDAIFNTGYDLIRRDERGNLLTLNDEVVTEHHPWPKSFPVASFFEHYWAWKKAVV